MPNIAEKRFDKDKVCEVSEFLQKYMKQNGLTQMTADECATVLADSNVLPNNIGPKPGFNFRQMLRDGRDGKIPLVTGAYQERPHARWQITKMAV